MRATDRGRIDAGDMWLTVALLALSLVVAHLLVWLGWDDGRELDARGVVLIALSTLPVLARRRPVAALLAFVPPQIVYHALDYVHDVSLPLAVVLIYRVSRATSRISTLVLLGFTSVVAVATIGLSQPGPPGPDVISPLAWFLVAAVGGQAVRMHQAYLVEATEHRVAQERLRIARELHDSLPHSIMVINSHAGVAAHLLDERAGDPALAPVARSLHTVADASSEVLSELRATLDLLRGNEVDSRAPTPGLDRLAELAAATGDAGVPVDLEVRGSPRPVGQTVAVTLYRITQEALTNVVKHAQATRARVELEYFADEVRLSVTDDGRGADGGSGTGGYGLVGMAERAHVVGGTIEHGDLPSGGFRVLVTVPVTVPE